MSYKRFLKFDEKWKLKLKKKRALTYEIRKSRQTDAVDNLNRLLVDTTHWVNILIKELHRGLIEGEYSKEELKPRNSTLEKRLFEEKRYLFDKWGLSDYGYCAFRRSLIRKAREVLLGCEKRFGIFPLTPPRIKNFNSFYVVQGVVYDGGIKASLIRGQLEIKMPGDVSMFASYRLSKGSSDKRQGTGYTPSGSIGGNLLRKKGKRGPKKTKNWNCFFFLAAPESTHDWLYQPACSIGIDINREGIHWLTFSTGMVIEMPDEVKRLTKELNNVNTEIKSLEKTLNDFDIKLVSGDKGQINRVQQLSRQRGQLRQKWKAAHKRMDEAVKPIARRIVDMTKDAKALLCLDSLVVGAKLGSFGHDHLRHNVVQIAEEERVPFVDVPTYWTSTAHHGCGCAMEKLILRYTKKGKPVYSSNYRVCEISGEKVESHKNASKIISEWGCFIWENGIKAFWKTYRKYKHTKKELEPGF